MISALQAAQLSQLIYDTRPSDWDSLISVGEVVAGLKHIGSDSVIAFRGSVTAADWLHDAEAVPVLDPEIGYTHAGFLDDMDAALEQIVPLLYGDVVFTGHSLGGARARIATAKLAVRRLPVAQCIVFGSPKPGYAQLADILGASGAAHTSYRNRQDPVPTLAPGSTWVHPDEWTSIDAAPPGEFLSDLRDHEVALYVQGVGAL